MKTENLFSAVIAAAVAALCSYAAQLLIPLAVLFAVVLLDYCTGMTKAWVKHELSSRTGVIGALKKISYFVMVAVAGVMDWLISSGLQSAGIRVSLPFLLALVVIVWLIINELISILENVAEIGGPRVPFLSKLLIRLKTTTEQAADAAAGDGEDE